MTDDRSAPGERRLAHPPSDRYRAAETAAAGRAAEAAGPPRPTSPARGVAIAAIVEVAGAIAITVLGGIVTLTAGLVVLAAVIGWATAAALRYGAGRTSARSSRVRIAVVMALGSVVLGQVGLWTLAGAEGGVLPLFDYLGEAFGVVVPLQLIVAPLSAWLSAR